jgi:hypothetical protein
MQYGYFDLEHKEYVITNPRTPVRSGSITSALRDFGGFVDHPAGIDLPGRPGFQSHHQIHPADALL